MKLVGFPDEQNKMSSDNDDTSLTVLSTRGVISFGMKRNKIFRSDGEIGKNPYQDRHWKEAKLYDTYTAQVLYE